MIPKYTYEQLVEKVVRAKVKLESAQRPHASRCVVEMDPDGHAPCNCGASDTNSALSSAMQELKL